MSSSTDVSDASHVLSLFCTQEGDAWHLYAEPGWMPPYLRRCFDREYEAYSILLDFEDLDRYMKKRGCDFYKHVTARGDVELTARGQAALELAVWLSKAFASGFREESGHMLSTGKKPQARG